MQPLSHCSVWIMQRRPVFFEKVSIKWPVLSQFQIVELVLIYKVVGLDLSYYNFGHQLTQVPRIERIVRGCFNINLILHYSSV